MFVGMYPTCSPKLVSQTFSKFRLTPGILKSANFNNAAVLWLQKVKIAPKSVIKRYSHERTVSNFLEQSLRITCP